MVCDVDLHLFFQQIYVVLSPLLFPLLCLEANRKGPCHLNRAADRKHRCCNMVEKPKNFVVKIDRSAAELNSRHLVVLEHVDLPNFLKNLILSFLVIVHYISGAFIEVLMICFVALKIFAEFLQCFGTLNGMEELVNPLPFLMKRPFF